MSSGSSSRVIVAATVGVVEALKDQGFCRRSIHQHANNHFGSYFQAINNRLSSSSSCTKAMVMSKVLRDHEKLNKSEESLRTVMYLSCWGPN